MAQPALDCSVPDRLDQLLKTHFGYDSLRPMQRRAMETSLAGKDVLLVLPTGGGKSLCYQLPALVLDAPVLVVSPLIALMEDQVAGARQAGIACAALHSHQTGAEQWRIAQDYIAGQIRLLYTSPERLVQTQLMDDLAGRPPALIAVDEAHCVSHWGHDFRPEYRQLAALFDRFSAPRLAVTATATPQVADDIIAQLGLRQAVPLIGHVDRPNLHLSCTPRADLKTQLSAFFADRAGRCGIVYCPKRKETTELADHFAATGMRCAAYHAGLSPQVRGDVLTDFIQDRLDVVFATVAFGMGIDRPDVRYVVHTALPGSMEAYVQEAGRAGRDGLTSECVLLHSGDDLRLRRFFINQDNPEPARRQAQERALQRLAHYANTPRCRHHQIVDHFGQQLGSTNCAACDVCDGSTACLETELAGEVAQAVCLAVKALDGRFGAGQVAAILSGSNSDKVTRWKHENLPIHGRLSAYSERQVRDWIHQLEQHDVVEIDRGSGYPLLIRGTARLDLKAPPLLGEAKVSVRKKRSAQRSSATEVEPQHRPLFEHLRAWRALCAKERALPAYVICSDRTLRHLASNRPGSAHELLAIHGIGAKKAEQIGDDLLQQIRDFEA
jgi:ATP-dependent DNA helicase RecQ